MSTPRDFLRSARASDATVIPDGDNQARTSQVDGETFFLGRRDSTTVDGAPVVTFANDRVTFRNEGSANTTGDTATVSVEGDRGTVKNSRRAEITAEQTAVDISGEDALIHNSGTIAGGFNGVNFVNGGESSGTLRNDGTVTSDSRAVNIGGEDIRVDNYGRILGTGDQRNGTVYSDATADDYTVNNFRRAVIDAGEGNDGAGIALQLGEEVEGDIYNAGLVQGRGQAPALNPDGTPNGLAGDGIRLFSGVEGPSTFEGNITNDGRILSESEQGPVAALRIANGVGFDGTITNGRRGVIDGVNNGLYFGTGEHDALVNNFGRILSDSRAVNIDGSGVELNNFGRILGTGDQRNGTVYADATAEDYRIFNGQRGVIDAGRDNNGSGVSLQTGDEDGDVVEAEVVNFGRISGRGNAEGNLIGHGVRVFSGVAEGTPVFRGDILNYGRITSEPSDLLALASGILVEDVAFEGDIRNFGRIVGGDDGIATEPGVIFTGDIVNRGRIEAGDDGIFIDDNANFTGDIVNDGRIKTDDEGVEFDPNATFTGNLVNNGRIDVEDDGIFLEPGVSFTGDIVNNGRIEADEFGIVINDVAAFDGEIVNHGTITGDDDGDGTGEAIDASQAQVDLTVINRGVLNGDVLLGGGNDLFDGANGRVDGEVSGGGGDDQIVAVGVDGRIDGGTGVDTIDFSGRGSGVIIDLDVNSAGAAGTPSQDGGILDAPPAAGGEVLQEVDDVENIIGTAFDDGLFGNNEANEIRGGAGNDVIHGFAGDDTLDGGEGIDTALFTAGPGDVTVDLELQGVAQDTGAAGVDTLIGIENVNGSAVGNDTLLGDAGANQLFGNGGNDTLNGRGANDVLIGGEGTDTFVFEQGTASDTVTDFTFADERLDVAAFFADQATALAAARQDGDDTVVDLDVGAGDEVRLVGVDVNDLQTENFIV